MKKNFLLASVAILSLGMINQSRADIIASGDDCAAEGSTCHWEIDSNGKLTITGSGAMKENFGNTKREDNPKVDSGATTAASWGDYHSSITSIEIGEGITDTGARSFQGLANVTSVTIPTSLTTLGAFAFDRQPDLVNFNVPEGSKLTNFSGNGTFHSGGSLTNTDAQKILDTMATNNKINGTTFDIPTYTFYESGTLENIVIPDGVGSIGDQAFRGNNLESVTIPSSVTNIGEAAFYDNSLETVSISNGVTDLGAYAFSHNSLTSVDIPESVTSMGNFAFGDNQLTEVTIPSGLTSLGEGAFYNNQLTSVDIPGSVTSIGEYAFYNNNLSELTLHEGLESIGYAAFMIYPPDGNTHLNTLIIPDSVTSIGESAFQGMGLSTVILPDSVASIADEAFGSDDSNDPIDSLKIICKGNSESCEKIKNFLQDICVNISGSGDDRRCDRSLNLANNVNLANESQCNSANYYWNGRTCNYEPDADSRVCDHEISGYVKVGDYCASPENTYAKKHYTPAEAAKWLHDGNDNFVVITFKK